MKFQLIATSLFGKFKVFRIAFIIGARSLYSIVISHVALTSPHNSCKMFQKSKESGYQILPRSFLMANFLCMFVGYLSAFLAH